MKCKTTFLLVWVPFVALTALGQTGSPAANEPSSTIAAAHCQYTPADKACAGALTQNESRNADATTIAQLPRRMPGPSRRPPRPSLGRPGAYYPGMRAGEGSGRRAAIGALIGLSLGAAIGSRGGAKASVLFGLIGAGCGAGMGASMQPFYGWGRHRPGPWPDDEDQEAALQRSGTKDQASETRSQGQ